MLISPRQLLLLLLAGISFNVSAAEITLKDQLICAVAEATLCRINTPCVTSAVEVVDLPLLLKLDLTKKTIKSTRMTGEARNSKIATLSTSKHNLILQGVEEGSGWSMTIDKSNGKMSVSSS